MAARKVAIIGGGIVGSMCAYELAAAGAKVTLFHNDAGGATQASAAMLEAQLDASRGEPFNGLSFASRKLFIALHEQLRQKTGIDIQYEARGILQAAVDSDDEAALRAEAERQRAFGWRAQYLAGADLKAKFPGLNFSHGAIFYEDDGQVNAPRFLEAARQAARAAGAALVLDDGEASLKMDGGRVVGAASKSTSADADVIVVAAGAWTDKVLAPLNVRLGIEPVRGQLLWHQGPSDALPIPVYTRRACYVVPKRDGTILAGTTVEKAGFDASTTELGRREIAAATEAMMPEISRLPVVSTTAGLRPASPDGLPVIGPLPGHENVIVASGHHRNGILLAPVTGAIVRSLVAGGPSPVDPSPFFPARLLAHA